MTNTSLSRRQALGFYCLQLALLGLLASSFGALLGWFGQHVLFMLLGDLLPSPQIAPRRLHEAMRYSTLGGGKRLRPVLVYCTGDALGGRSFEEFAEQMAANRPGASKGPRITRCRSSCSARWAMGRRRKTSGRVLI